MPAAHQLASQQYFADQQREKRQKQQLPQFVPRQFVGGRRLNLSPFVDELQSLVSGDRSDLLVRQRREVGLGDPH